MNRRVAVIDVGSNSIKALVAESDGSPYGIIPVIERSLDVRISKGISGNPPVLNETSRQFGIDAVEHLCRECQSAANLFRTIIVATSAVRSADNGLDFINAIKERTGVLPIILTGEEEADGIAFGVRTDPDIRGESGQYTVFDLGGGSLELIRFCENHVERRTSLKLGSVRLAEMFLSHPGLPIPAKEVEQLKAYIRDCILQSGFKIEKPLIGCSGGLTTWRAIRASASGLKIRQSSAIFSEKDIADMAREAIGNDFDYRVNTLGIPPGRADIFPVAVITFQLLLKLAGTHAIRHSLHNLQYGIAWKALSEPSQDCS